MWAVVSKSSDCLNFFVSPFLLLILWQKQWKISLAGQNIQYGPWFCLDLKMIDGILNCLLQVFIFRKVIPDIRDIIQHSNHSIQRIKLSINQLNWTQIPSFSAQLQWKVSNWPSYRWSNNWYFKVHPVTLSN